jgi:hypothetical protein
VVLTIMSYVPFSAPVGDADAALPGRGAVVGAAGLARDPDRDVRRRRSWSARRSIQNSLLRMGARVKLGEALRG